MERTYKPQKMQKQEIPKVGSAKKRVLSIPTIRDRRVSSTAAYSLSATAIAVLDLANRLAHTLTKSAPVFRWGQASHRTRPANAVRTLSRRMETDRRPQQSETPAIENYPAFVRMAPYKQ